jgi:hypothetical protein
MDGFVRRGSDEVGCRSQHLRGAHDPGGRSLPRLPSLSPNELSALAAIFARPATLVSRPPGLDDGFAAGLVSPITLASIHVACSEKVDPAHGQERWPRTVPVSGTHCKASTSRSMDLLTLPRTVSRRGGCLPALRSVVHPINECSVRVCQRMLEMYRLPMLLPMMHFRAASLA